MCWEEEGGPPVATPLAQGYGTKVINASVLRQLNGGASFDWRPGGLRFEMSVPIGERAAKPRSKTNRRTPSDKPGAGD